MRADILERRTQNTKFDPGPPNVFGEEDLGIQATREAISGPEDKVIRQRQKAFGSIEQPGAKDQLDDLFGDETTRQAEGIRAILDDPNHPQLSPDLERSTARGLAQDTLALKSADQTAKKVFDQIAELEQALVLPKTSSQAERIQLGKSKKALQRFKKEAAKAAESARQTNDPSQLEALLDRLSGPLKTDEPFTRTAEDVIQEVSGRPQDAQFSRSFDEISQQRINQAQQGPQPTQGKSFESRRPLPFDPSVPKTPPVEFELTDQEMLLNTLTEILNARGK